MDWTHLLSTQRLNAPNYQPQPHRPIFLQDLDRITFSAPFRRLANKTQVHPLYENDHLHHRLIHSIETASVGRSLGTMVGDWLEREKSLPLGTKEAVSNAVQAACLAHDIGNPPFGHAGEEAIGEWFRAGFAESRPLLADLAPAYRHEFEAFEGNAQGFRILTQLEMYRNNGGMRLALAVLGSFLKYPVTAKVQSAEKARLEGKKLEPGLKKFGVFETEAAILSRVCAELGMLARDTPEGAYYPRHPLVFLVEAADDICYGVLDTEDAVTAGDVDFKSAAEALGALADAPNPTEKLADSPKPNSSHERTERIAHLRALAVHAAVESCVEAFKAHYDEILGGNYCGSLTGDCRKASAFTAIKSLAREQIYTAPRKAKLESVGRDTLHRVLSGLLPVFVALHKAGWNSENLPDNEASLRRELDLDLRDVTDELTALHALTDYVSGMTDRYAVKVAQMLSGL